MALVLYGNLTEYTNYNTHTIHKEPCLTVFLFLRVQAAKKRVPLRVMHMARAIYADLKKSEAEHIATGHSIYFLRHRHLRQWAPSSAESSAVREVPQRFKRDRSDRSDLIDLTDQERWALYAFWLEHESAEVRANAIICLIHQANYLLDRQIASLEAAFVEEGGYSEQLAAARLAERERRRNGTSRHPKPAGAIPSCPQCCSSMVLRTARAGKNEGQQFWGCTGYPDCRGVVKV